MRRSTPKRSTGSLGAAPTNTSATPFQRSKPPFVPTPADGGGPGCATGAAPDPKDFSSSNQALDLDKVHSV